MFTPESEPLVATVVMWARLAYSERHSAGYVGMTASATLRVLDVLEVGAGFHETDPDAEPPVGSNPPWE